MYLQNQTINLTEESNYTLAQSDNLLDNPILAFYQAIYGSSLLVVVALMVLKSVTFTWVRTDSSLLRSSKYTVSLAAFDPFTRANSQENSHGMSSYRMEEILHANRMCTGVSRYKLAWELFFSQHSEPKCLIFSGCLHELAIWRLQVVIFYGKFLLSTCRHFN